MIVVFESVQYREDNVGIIPRIVPSVRNKVLVSLIEKTVINYSEQ